MRGRRLFRAGATDPSPWALAIAGQVAAAWLVIRGDAKRGEYDVPAFTAFVTQLGLSAGWLLLFVGLRRPGAALADACMLWLAVVVTLREFDRKHRFAAALLLPYLLWVSYVAVVSARAAIRSN